MKRNNPIFPILLALIIGCLILLAFVGCKSAAPVIPTNTHDRDSVRIEYRQDSIYIYKHDSVFVDRWKKGDTVFVTKTNCQIIYKDRLQLQHDSVYINLTDTIYNTVTVEKKGSMFLRNSGIALWVLIALAVIAAIVGIVLKFAK